MLTPMLRKITLLFHLAVTSQCFFSCHFAKYQFIWFTVLTKDFNKNVPNINQIFHIYQIKNLYTKHVKNISNSKNLVCTVLYTSWQHCSLDQRTCGLLFSLTPHLILFLMPHQCIFNITSTK